MSTSRRVLLAIVAGLCLVATPLFVLQPADVSAADAMAQPLQAIPTGRDADDDGLPDALEPGVGTSATKPDTDGDGLPDGGDPDIVAYAVRRLPVRSFAGGAESIRRDVLAAVTAIQAQLKGGRIGTAISQIIALRTRVDGCPTRADATDWIVRCGDQVRIRDLLDLIRANRVTFAVDPKLPLPITSMRGIKGAPSRPVVVAVGPDGTPEEFVANEVLVQTAEPAVLAAFLKKYAGSVLRDPKPLVAQGTANAREMPASVGWYLVRIDPSRSAVTDLARNLELGGLRGKWRFSSANGERTVALIARERGLRVAPNIVQAQLAQCTVCEAAIPGGNLDAAAFPWMTEDNAPTTPGDQGLSVGVIHAWRYLRYQGYPPVNVPFPLFKLAIIDSGFDLDPTTGMGNADYSPNPPAQIDAVDGDLLAGGAGSGWSNCPSNCWHGQMTFGVSLATPNNGFGTAGTSGGLARPLLVKIDPDFDTIARGVTDAVASGADVISMSIAGECGWICKHYGGGNELKDAVKLAKAYNIPIVASAGNFGRDIGDQDLYPCVLDGVICVGAIVADGSAPSYSNWGAVVDMFAPAGILTTRLPTSSPSYPYAAATGTALELFGGTSASAPFLAGIVALMKMLDTHLTYDQLRTILWDTANPSSDPKIAPTGYVDAYRAVAAVKPNEPPTIAVTAPSGSEVPYADVLFKADVSDPEWAGPYAAEFPMKVAFRSSRDGALCSTSTIWPTATCTAAHDLSAGTHVITATATDAFGAETSATATITVVNTGPTVKITYPATGSTFYASQKIDFRGYAWDPDAPIPASEMTWTSSRDGKLGVGAEILVNLSVGTHTITLRATDERGATGQDAITVVVKAGGGYPTARITWPPASQPTVGRGKALSLSGEGTDPEDGTLPLSALAWSDDLDGFLGTGSPLPVVLSSRGACTTTAHWVTLTVTDSEGHTGSASMQISVIDVC